MAYDVKKRYKYYFETPYSASPWSFAGIMSDIQHRLYNGEGLTEEQVKRENLINRINKLSGNERAEAYSELQEARAMADRRAERDHQKMQSDKEESKLDAIKAYRTAWKRTSFFYKITHKKQNPINIDFDSMDSSEILSKESRLRK